MFKVASGRRVLLVVLLVAAALAWVISRGPDDLMYQPAVIESHEPDYSLADFTVTLMDRQGLPAYQVRAESMQHYSDDMIAYWSHPQVSLLRQGQTVWNITANEARSPDQEDYIKLDGDVRLTQVGVHVDLREVTAGEMILYTKDQVIRSDGVVSLIHSAGETKGTGMRADLQSRRIQLLSNVTGEYNANGSANGS